MPIEHLHKRRLILFRDPARPGFPNVMPEVGITHETFFAGKQNKQLAVLVILPVTQVSKITERHYLTPLASTDQKEKVDMGLNPNPSYIIGHHLGFRRSRRDFEDSVRVIPVVDTVLDLDGQRRFHALGSCPDEIWTRLQDKLNRFFDENPEAQKQLLHDAKRAFDNRENLSALEQKPRSPGEIKGDRMGGVEVVTRRRRIFTPPKQGDGPENGEPS